ncbi:MAG TPA: riboflavin synthase [Armatimonadetes bacterium]|nr:riboflavin synthase [Armatimonadota bacterium]
MFTGLIEELGTVQALRPRGQTVRLEVRAEQVLSDLQIGDSICVNGACLTVTERLPMGFACEVVSETLQRTNLGRLRPGDEVNLERPLRADGRLGGHFVQGHVDGLGTIARMVRQGEEVLCEIRAPAEVLRYVVPKGSIAVDGVSLTVVERLPTGFTVALIPHTLAATTLGRRQMGEVVNLEADILAKYVAAAVEQTAPPSATITPEFLAEHGFK